ncbi:hypothetical protein AX16_004785 [Volvariella volvacea WC 439]|nr:hypothetical protein AX16_004785 [Volvariella volvacea WC 439]
MSLSVLPSPFHYFQHFLQLALSVLFSLLTRPRRTTRAATEYDVSYDTGFLPSQPLPRLPPSFELWEQALDSANGTLQLNSNCERAESWRAAIRSWPVLDVSFIQHDVQLLQRAHLVLAWLVHSYAHSSPEPEDKRLIIPESLAVPLVKVSRELGMAPVLTFADTVLWNWQIVNPRNPLTIDNMEFVNTFSGTADERNFFAASAKAELYGVRILQIVDSYYAHQNIQERTVINKLARDLHRLTAVIKEITEAIRSIPKDCKPKVFYDQIRPWFVGSNPKGVRWVYEGVGNSDALDLDGPSGGQSSIMHVVDTFFDIDHLGAKRRVPSPSSDNGFMQRMRRYMPGKHRDYLNYLSSMNRPIRDVAAQSPALKEAFDDAVNAMRNFRRQHLAIAHTYIVSQTHQCPVLADRRRETPELGTGGTQLRELLKNGLQATTLSMLSPSQ